MLRQKVAVLRLNPHAVESRPNPSVALRRPRKDAGPQRHKHALCASCAEHVPILTREGEPSSLHIEVSAVLARGENETR
jgi:hypothetical protein